MLINKVNKQLTYIVPIQCKRHTKVFQCYMFSHCITERERERESIPCLGIVDQEISTYTWVA